ncbi:MAG: NAD(P)H-binding protein [Chromatiales bacterium]|nr:NAD(P)H-binding protein [Chromatiales bacterium]
MSAASGRLGRAILGQLVAERSRGRLTAVVRRPDDWAMAEVEARAGDYLDPAALRGALEGVNVLVMISAPVGTGDRLAMHRNVIAAAREAGVGRVIFTSVIGGPGEEETLFWPMQQENRQTEADLRESGLAWTIGRNGLYLELDIGHILAAARGSGVYRNNGGEGRCGYISLSELAVAYARLALDEDHAGRTWSICAEPVTQAEIVAAVNDVFGTRVRYEAISLQENITRFMADEKIAARGEKVARMLSGCFQCIASGAFAVRPDFEQMAGRSCHSLRAQVGEIRRRLYADWPG